MGKRWVLFPLSYCLSFWGVFSRQLEPHKSSCPHTLPLKLCFSSVAHCTHLSTLQSWWCTAHGNGECNTLPHRHNQPSVLVHSFKPVGLLKIRCWFGDRVWKGFLTSWDGPAVPAEPLLHGCQLLWSSMEHSYNQLPHVSSEIWLLRASGFLLREFLPRCLWFYPYVQEKETPLKEDELQRN